MKCFYCEQGLHGDHFGGEIIYRGPGRGAPPVPMGKCDCATCVRVMATIVPKWEPLDDRVIARRADLRSRVIVTMKVRVNSKPAPNERISAPTFRRAMLRQYIVEWVSIFFFAVGLALAIVRAHQ